ncbi:PolC-type DNA polymerase III [Candidatus Cetobacterium colombiensis]|uniref:DNA polymerase III PolC-type n=1 Tax=Candidatus Cetobacterium colombiensis TaxID=3073100 RepID=A0ABU4W763_9FUSO|nr:PolC-type DNA polymerase III [Candidatus Cetobacterium colombiensis]MDX8335354.1 PolC-type DNA polymerase III [Candidatus Cetobacterium colombiensis]
MGIENIEVTEIVFSERNKKMDLICVVSTPQDLKGLDKAYENLKKKFGNELDIDFKINYMTKEISRENFLEIVERVIEKLKKTNAISKSFLYLYRISIKGETVDIELKNEMAVETLYGSNLDIKIQSLLENYGIKGFKVNFVSGDFNSEIKNIEDEIENKIITLNSQPIEKEVIQKPVTPQVEIKSAVPTGRGGFSKKKDIKSPSMPISEFKELIENEIAVVEGELFATDGRELRTGKILQILRITDGEDSITAKIFLNKADEFDVKVGDFIKISGKKQIDSFENNEEIILVNILNKLDKKKTKKQDTSEEKMVELHTHTKMSEMCGVEDVKGIVGRALDYGHKAVAITDYGVVHAFPFAYKAAKGKDIKIIFGCEMYMVDDSQPIVQNAKDVLIDEETYVVFDLETLGLNSHKNEIIEIGAIKLQGRRIVDRYSQLINPGKKIPKKIQEITGITDSMVENMPMIDEVLPKFMEFLGDATLVAHNAPFDMGFLKRDAKKYMNLNYNPSVIDTLQMARDLYPDQKGYGLKPMTKFLKVALENHHRAVDDSQATAAMFAIFLEKYLEKGIVNQKDMTGAFPLNYKKQDIRNIMVLVKELVGLKNLYKLVSQAHIDYFGNKKPRILRSVLNENREGLIIGAPTSIHFSNSGELSEAYFRNDLPKVEKLIDFYDYIELQPRIAFSEFLDTEETGAIASFKDVEKMNKYFYELAKERGKIVTASSNVHYLEKEDHKIRSILLYGSGSVFRDNQYRVDNGFYFRTTDELLNEFNYLGEDISKEIVVKATNQINDMIEKIQPIPSGFYPPKIDNAENIVREMTYEKAYELYGNPLPENVEARIERELKAIIGNGFSVLYLSAQKLVKKSLDNGYLVGSRGSVGSSIVAYMMGITEVNALYPHYLCTNPNCKHSEFIEREGAGVDLPDKDCPKCGTKLKKDGHSIPFEVFMGFNGDKVPDIDLNFSGEYQSEIHRYCEDLFGKANVFKAGTISTLAEKNAEGYVRKFFEDHNIISGRAEVMRMAQKCEGAKKTTGQHPGGMIVVPQGNSIYEFCPVQRPANDQSSDSTTTHYDYHVMDEQLVKLDILGHDDPTTIKMLQEYTGVNVYDIPLGDPETLKIFSGTESLGVTKEEIGSIVGTYGVPEFGTGFVRQMLVDTMPTTFAELVRISGLSHGTDVWLNNAQEFVREGKATLSQVISVRDDIMNFLIDQGIEKGVAFKIMEFVRKGQPSKNVAQWKEYSDLMKEHGVPEWYIESCRRIKYMFPKGHAVAYVMMAMRIAYFKVHYPLAFYAAYLSRKVEDFDFELMNDLNKVNEKIQELNKEPKLDVKKKAQLAVCEIIVEMHARGFEFLNLDVYKSHGYRFTIEDGKIRVPLMGLNGLGTSVMENIVRERELGRFISYEDFKRRTKTSQTTVDKLKELNCIESLSETNQTTLFF